MEIPEIIQKLDSDFQRQVRSLRTTGQKIVSWEVDNRTVTINDTEINKCARICLKNTEEIVYLYAVYIFRDDEKFNRHYHKFLLSEIESIEF